MEPEKDSRFDAIHSKLDGMHIDPAHSKGHRIDVLDKEVKIMEDKYKRAILDYNKKIE